jgi:hypothetical protein
MSSLLNKKYMPIPESREKRAQYWDDKLPNLAAAIRSPEFNAKLDTHKELDEELSSYLEGITEFVKFMSVDFHI